MMADFMGYSFAVSLLFAVATLGVEQVCALYRWPRRSPVPVTTRLIAAQAGPQEVDLELQIRRNLTTTLSQPPSDQWVHAATMRIRYGSTGTVDLYATDASPPRKVQIVLRPELLYDLSDPR